MLPGKVGELKSCSICGNQDKSYFFKRKDGTYYCRKCVNYKKREIADINYFIGNGYDFYLNYNLTKKQKEASNFILNNIEIKDIAINAVCGAGKSEIIYNLIKSSLYKKRNIGIAIPRKDVVIELVERLSRDFKDNSVIGVYGGSTSKLNGDIIIFTTHQAYRFINYFETLIIDEVDAFPYKGNEELKHILNKCCRGHKVYLSATMPKYIENDDKIAKFHINRRYHNIDLPVPNIKTVLFLDYYLKKFIEKHKNKRILIFFPTIALLSKTSKRFKIKHIVMHSKIDKREETLALIKKSKKGVIFTTSVLERGITLKGVQVIVYRSDHNIFNKDMLIQISGRVGRNKNEAYGEVVFLAKRSTSEMKKCVKTIIKYNNA